MLNWPLLASNLCHSMEPIFTESAVSAIRKVPNRVPNSSMFLPIAVNELKRYIGLLTKLPTSILGNFFNGIYV